MRILIHDFAGHPFAAELSRALAGAGHQVTHAHCAGVTTGRGDLDRRDGDPATLTFRAVSDVPFERYSAAGRIRSELAYGRSLAQLVSVLEPDVVVSANCPLLAQRRLWRAARRVGSRRVYWLQDFLGRGTRTVLAERSAPLAATAGRSLEALEARLLQGSDHIIVIADDFEATLHQQGIRTPTTVVENWTPLNEVSVAAKDNAWSRAHDLAERPVAVYSGTLGLKHDPEHLVAAAVAIRGTPARVVVVTEGLGREHLARRKAELQLDELLLMDFVPYDVLPDLLGAADVCLVLLEREAGTFSVPSKVLTYLAAGRAVVGALPPQNLAARTLREAGAGAVVPPGDHGGFARAVVAALQDPSSTRAQGLAGRRHAEANFGIDGILARVEPLLKG